MDPKLFDEMAAMEERHFWFKGRRRILRTLLSKVLPPSPQTHVLDLGCGCGQNLAFFSSDYAVEGMDASDQAIAYCRARGLTVHQGMLPGPLPFDSRKFDACLLLDVLEHVNEDRAAVQIVRTLLKSKGIVMATVPAFPFLYTGRDRFHGHKRRYTKPSFASLFPESDWRIINLTYFNTLLFPVSASLRILSKTFNRDKAAPDLFIPFEPLNSLLTGLFSLERLILPSCSLPFGLSLLIIAESRNS